MSDDVVIKVENLSKKFIKKDGTEFWALKDVNFEVKKGESIGIIGPNGSGKSTLLKILSGVVKPTSGRILIKGTISSILDVGAGFHPELSGKDNVYLKGALIGMTKNKMDSVYDEILKFSELETFINEPVKTYSNGMFLRLAFSISLFFDFTVLLLDEVLNVGDQFFQKKCFHKIDKLRNKEFTSIFVSHNVNELTQITNKLILFKFGTIECFESIDKVLIKYNKNLRNANNSFNIIYKEKHTIFNPPYEYNSCFLTSLIVKSPLKKIDEPLYSDDEIQIVIDYEKTNANQNVFFFISIDSIYSKNFLSDSEVYREESLMMDKGVGLYKKTITIPKQTLNHGTYTINLKLGKYEEKVVQYVDILDVLTFNIEKSNWEIQNGFIKDVTSPLRPRLLWISNKKE